MDSTTELRFRAMGSDAHIIVVGGEPDLAERARTRLAQLEGRWSRFLPASEVSELTRSAGTAVAVSDDTVLLVRRAVEAWRLSGGSFDPTVLGDVIRAGYDRSFDDLPATRSRRPASHLTVGCADIEVTDHHVTLPEGTGFDPGGIGKGLAADLIGREIRAAGADGVCVNLGGDLRVSGSAPGGGTWTVGVEHAWSAAPLALIGLAGGAVATSTTLRRRWELDGVEHHHLIDPGTGEPSDTDLTSATVVTGQAWMAEVLAKAVLLRGSAHPFDLIGGTSAEAIVVDEAGRVTASPGFGAYLGSARPPDGIKVAPHDRRCPA